jgi:small nuclear ribonucleoprotein
MSDHRPLDVLEDAVGDRVSVSLKGGDRFAGELLGFDQHMNLVLGPVGGSAAADTEAEEPAPETAETVDNTTVIRGDNLVSIQP